MIERKAIKYLEDWAVRPSRKPLILRGARQVGKTTLINEFAKQFDVYLSLNLDKPSDSKLFELYSDLTNLVNAIYRHCKQLKKETKTLLLIDEIQNSAKAVAMLRYFYEEQNHIHVIAAGSLLESLIDKQISFPVGRVEYLALRPCSFLEFLDGIGENFDSNLIQTKEVADVHERLIQLFNDYSIVGGMPAAIVEYAKKRDVLALNHIYESLLNSYADDVEKYARNNTMMQIIRYIIKNGWSFAAERISFERFGNSNYKSREVGEALRTLEKTMLLELVYPIVEPKIPITKMISHKPKLFWIDTGLVNYAAGVREQLFLSNDILDAWRGRIAEQIVGQELLALHQEVSAYRVFWERNKPQSSAEVDFVIQFRNLIIPIEVKSGTIGKLKSLHQFMEVAPHHIAIRVWSKPFSVEQVSTANGKEFKLINIPFYLLSQLENIIGNNL